MAGFVVQLDDETAEKLTDNYSDGQITEVLTETLEKMANEPPRKRAELRRNMGLPEVTDDDDEEKSQEQLAEELREFMSPSHPRSKDPRL